MPRVQLAPFLQISVRYLSTSSERQMCGEHM